MCLSPNSTLLALESCFHSALFWYYLGMDILHCLTSLSSMPSKTPIFWHHWDECPITHFTTLINEVFYSTTISIYLYMEKSILGLPGTHIVSVDKPLEYGHPHVLGPKINLIRRLCHSLIWYSVIVSHIHGNG